MLDMTSRAAALAALLLTIGSVGPLLTTSAPAHGLVAFAPVLA